MGRSYYSALASIDLNGSRRDRVTWPLDDLLSTLKRQDRHRHRALALPLVRTCKPLTGAILLVLHNYGVAAPPSGSN